VFESLTEKFSSVFRSLSGRGRITEANVSDAMNDVRKALLEADVNYNVVKQFCKDVRDKAIGAEVIKSLHPGQMMIKIVHDELVRLMGAQNEPLTFAAKPPTVIMMVGLQGQGKTTIYIPNWIRITKATLGMAAAAGREKGFWETLFFKSMFLTTPIAFLLLAAAIVVMYKTRFGLRLRSCGEHPQAADAVGINVYKMRYSGVLISGFLAGIGGIAFTIAAGSGFQSTVAGYGFLALAVMIFGNWKPWRILGAAVFFAFFKVIGAYSGSLAFLPDFKGVGSSQYIYQMLPYIVTMIVLIFSSKKSRAPKAEGIPYDKGKR